MPSAKSAGIRVTPKYGGRKGVFGNKRGKSRTDTKPGKKGVQGNSFFFYLSITVFIAGLNGKKFATLPETKRIISRRILSASYVFPRLSPFTCFAFHGAGQMFSRALALRRRSNDNRYKYFLLIILIIKYFFLNLVGILLANFNSSTPIRKKSSFVVTC